MTRRTTIIFGISGLAKLVMLCCRTIFFFGGGGGRGIGGGVRENKAYCSLLRLVNLLTFIQNGGSWKVTLQSRLKKVTHFSCYESVPKGYNVQMSLCLTLTWDAMSRNGQRQGYVVQHSLPQEKSPSAAQLKLLFGDSCSVFNNKWHAHAMRDEPIVRVQTPPTR